MKKLYTIIYFLLVFAVLSYPAYHIEKIGAQKSYEEEVKEVIETLQTGLEKYDKKLASFVDQDYKTVTATETNDEGVYRFTRGLAKNKETFGNYIVLYDMKNNEVLSDKLEIENGDFKDEWELFVKKDK